MLIIININISFGIFIFYFAIITLSIISWAESKACTYYST